MGTLDTEYIGARLLERGFETWFRYMFRTIEGKEFIVEPIHEGLFDSCDKIVRQIITRLNINVPPRAGKTTLAKGIVAYALTINPKSNIIYTSFSQSLLTDIALAVRDILEHPVYKAMYPSSMYYDNEETRPIDDFWLEYLRKETGKNTYSAKKITTAQGGVCLFSSIGSQITGYGAGIRNAKGFNGALIIDDANKPADIRSQVMREKVVRYYEETLLSRLNNSDVPIINIQQRLHLEDLSGVLEEKYNFETLKRPLLDENGVCQLPSQYTPERIEELKVNNYMFLSQYQQEPIVLGGAIIKRAYFRYYPTAQEFDYKRILIAADTAMKTQECNDYSVFIVGGVTQQNQLHILDLVRGKWEAPELERMAIMIWNKYRRNEKTGLCCSGMYVEDKASGTGLIQGLKTKYGIPVLPVQADKDKLTRVENILPYVEAGNIYLPENENHAFNPDFISECEAFSRDMSHTHDDQVDAFAHLVSEALARNVVSILDFCR